MNTLNVIQPTDNFKPAVDPKTLAYRDLLEGDFWRKIPAYKDVDRKTFLDYRWQSKKSIRSAEKLLASLEGIASPGLIADVKAGFKKAPMSVQVSPYLLSLINWEDPANDPLRIQFIPMGSLFLPDHPKLGLDSLGEQADAAVPGLTHRYPDKALFLVIDTCPVYCRFCTRSYAVGVDTEEVEKISLVANKRRWERTFEYIESRPELEDIVISGGDSYNLRPDWIHDIGTRLMKMDNIRRIRFASKGLAVMPSKVLTDDAWFKALAHVHKLGHSLGKEVAFHTHFNNAAEITDISRQAIRRMFDAGITVRNQSVLIRGVNDTSEKMRLLVKRLGWVNAHPYYVYVHDLVQGGEEMRTTVQTAVDLEKHVRGTTAGFNTPTFVVDAPGGGGKRNAPSFEHYNRDTGISVYAAPSVKPGKLFLYFDPVDKLAPEYQERWAHKEQQDVMINNALAAAREGLGDSTRQRR